MATQQGNTEFVLVQKDGYSEHPLYQADDLDEMAQYIEMKGGVATDGSG